MFRPNDAEGGRTGGAGGVTSLRWGVERTASPQSKRGRSTVPATTSEGATAPGRSRAQASSSLQEAESCCAGAPERGALVQIQMAMRAAGAGLIRVAPRVRTHAVSAKPPTILTATLSSADDQPTTAPADFVPGALFA